MKMVYVLMLALSAGCGATQTVSEGSNWTPQPAGPAGRPRSSVDNEHVDMELDALTGLTLGGIQNPGTVQTTLGKACSNEPTGAVETALGYTWPSLRRRQGSGDIPSNRFRRRTGKRTSGRPN